MNTVLGLISQLLLVSVCAVPVAILISVLWQAFS
jgi:hypothetical protein